MVRQRDLGERTGRDEGQVRAEGCQRHTAVRPGEPGWLMLQAQMEHG